MVGDPAVPSDIGPPFDSGPPPDTGFAVVRRGYDQGQVDAHLSRLDAEIQILVHDRDAAVDQSAQLTRELDESRALSERLLGQVRTLASPPHDTHGMSERMRTMLRLAEDEVAEMLAGAEADGHKRLREAEQQAAQIVAEARSEADAVRAAARADSEASERQRAVAWAESQARCAEVEEDFTIAMNQRRSHALAALTTERLDARRESEAMRDSAATWAREHIDEAQAQGRTILAEAERRLAQLVELRGRIVEQLGGARAVLDRTLDALSPLPEEPDGPNGTTTAATTPAAPDGTDDTGYGTAGSASPSPVPGRSERRSKVEAASG